MRRRLLVVLGAAVLGVLVPPAHPAHAHPLGNFSINQYHGFTIRPDAVTATVVVDRAEIPTRQRRTIRCVEVAAALDATVERGRLRWTIEAEDLTFHPGAAELPTSRLSCILRAVIRPLGTGAVRPFVVANGYAAGQVGWHEMTAVGDGVRLIDSPLATRSVSDELRAYPADPLASPLDVRAASLRFKTGGSADAAAGQAAGTNGRAAPAGGAFGRLIASADRRLADLAGAGRLTPAVGLLAVLLAFALGAGHAALPGHGKTALAAYAAARGGRRREAVALLATVTATHTGGVLAVGALLTTSAAFAGERLLAWLGIVSGAVVVAVGAGMLAAFRRGRSHSHGHGHSPGHSHPHSHSHDGHSNVHDHRPGGRLGLFGIGLAGGLVPSPSALVVLLGAVGLGRTAFGVLLVIAYGVGMAATLTAAGFALLGIQRWATSRATHWRADRMRRVLRRLPSAGTATASLVMVVGAGLALRAIAALS
jgi:nickel/cobalt transporter (NicO) family protein